VDKGHGRVERRTLRTTSLLTLHGKWPGLKQGFEVRRERTERGETTAEVAYGVTSLGPERADAQRLLGLVRGHWRIESCLHDVRDVTPAEDACRVRKGSAPQVLAALRNGVVHLLREAPEESRPAALERLSARPQEALQLIGLPAFN
jgi:hypothetical protein